MPKETTTLRRILERDRTIAVVGLSADAHRPSYGVARYMQQHGYRIVPVNPRYPAILGETAYARLEDIPFAIDMVNVFRREEDIALNPVPAISTSSRKRDSEAVVHELLKRCGIDAVDLIEKLGRIEGNYKVKV